MIAVALQFSNGGSAPPVFDFTTTVQGFATTVQNTMVCMGTSLGSDQIFTDRGTTILADANQGGLTDVNSANQSASFAANDALIFTQLNDDPNNPYRLTSLALNTVSMAGQVLNLSVTAQDANGDSIGVAASM